MDNGQLRINGKTIIICRLAIVNWFLFFIRKLHDLT